MGILLFFAKIPFILPWNMFMLFVYTLELLWRVRKLLWDPRTWLTVLFFYVFSNFFLLSFQLGLDLFLLLLTGKTLTDFIPSLGNWLSNYAISSAVTTLLFSLTSIGIVVKSMKWARELKIFRDDVMKEIAEYNRGFLISRVKRYAILTVIGLLIGLVVL